MEEFITLSDIVREVCEDAKKKDKEIINIKKVREKYLELFGMMNIDREKLKKDNDYQIPQSSLPFLKEMYWFYTDADGKKMRKGKFAQTNLGSILKLLEGFKELILGLDLPDNEKDEMISNMYMRTKYPYLLIQSEILEELEKIRLDFCPDYKNDEIVEDKFQKYMSENNNASIREGMKIMEERRFRYFDVGDALDVNDEILFMTFVLEDIRCLIKRHRELYYYIAGIRQEEINDASERETRAMTEENEIDALKDMNASIELQNELGQNKEYTLLMEQRKQLLRSEDFIRKVQPKFSAICERIQEIRRETQIKLWGEVRDNDFYERKQNFLFRETSENVFMEALKSYEEDNKVRREFERKRNMISDEQRERISECLAKMMAERNIHN